MGSMGNDAPLAVLSERPQPLFRYFKQQFAQVTNPPIDPIREKLVMTLTSCLGGEGNLLAETPRQCRLLELRAARAHQRRPGQARCAARSPTSRCASCRWSSTVDAPDAGAALERALVELCAAAEQAVDEGASILRR